MMDMRQHGGGAMPSNTLQFSPQSTLSNDNLFLLDPNFSPSPSMDLCGPPFPSQVGSDFPSVYMDSSFQNAVMGSSMECLQGQALSADGFYAADEWSGTTNSTSGGSNSQPHHHNHQQDASSSQRQSSLAQNPVNQSVSLDQDGMVVQPLMNKGFHQGGEMIAGQGRLQGMVKQLSALTQGSLLPQQVLLQEECKNVDFQVDFYGHQRSNSEGTMSANLLADRLPHEDRFQEARQLQLHGLELLNQQEGLGSTPRAGLQGVHGQQEDLANTLRIGPQGVNDQQAPGQTPIYHDKEGDTSASSYHILNSGTLFQAGHGENTTGQPTPGGAQIGQHSDQQGLQRVRSLALQLQGRLSHSALQTPLANQSQYLNHAAASLSAQQLVLNTQHTQGPCDQLGSLQSHSNSHQLSMLLQSQASAQFQSLSQAHAQAQAKVQVQAQAQSVNQQQAATNQQTVFQPRQLQQGGPQQSPLVHGSQQNTFQSMQLALATSQALPGTSHNLHVNGSSQEMMSQMQPRLLNPAFQGLKAAVPQVLQRFPSGPSLGFNNGQDGNLRTQMPSAIAARCIHVLMQYIQEQQNRPADNNIVFWRNLVNKFFVPGATKRWCLSSYNSSPMGRHAQGLFPMDCWFCNLCGVQPGRGFESGTDVLPRLFKIKYDSGLVDELLFLDIAEERYMLPNGRLVLEFPRAVHESIFPRAVHESIFPELRVVRYGRLRVTFSSYFKIYSWEFCTKIHEEVVPRKSLFQQAQQLAKLVMDCDQEAFDKSAANLKAYCNEFTATAKQLASKLEAPSVNDLGFSKRYVRCLQIAEVVNSMKDLISFERKTGSGPINSLATFPSIRKVPEEQLTQSTSSQLINQQPSQGTISSSSSYLTLQQLRQAQMNNSLQPGMVRGSDARSHLDMPTQAAAVQTQMPSVQQAQAQSANQLLNQLSARSISPMQGSSFRQVQPQMSSQVLGNQAVNFSQIAQQIYDAAGNRQQLLQQSCVPPAQSLNHTGGQQSLPGTPQSEMSDMRTNT